MSTQDPAEREALRQEIQAAIAAGRDLDPTMDPHLADSALERVEQERAARNRALNIKQAAPAPAMPGHPNPNLEYVMRTLITVAIVGGIVLAVVTKTFWGFPWWILFFIGPALGGWWGRGRRRYTYSAQGYQQHHDDDSTTEDLRRQEREIRRRLKIQRMQAELDRLKSGEDA